MTAYNRIINKFLELCHDVEIVSIDRPENEVFERRRVKVVVLGGSTLLVMA